MAKRLATWVMPSIVIAVVVTFGIFCLAPLMTQDRERPTQADDAVGVNLTTLAAPEPEPEDEAKEPEKPQEEPQTDFQPDLIQPDLISGLGGLDLGVAISLRGLGRENTSGDFVFSAGQLDQPPQPAVRVPPAYPYKARQLGIIGSVRVKMLVLADGSVEQVRVLDAQPQGVFEDSVLKTLPSWRYTPGRIKGKPVTAWIETTIRFDLT